MKVRFGLASLLLVFAVLLAACGGGAAATEAPASSQDSNSGATTTQAAEAPVESGSQFFLQITKVVGTVEVRASANDAYAPAEVGKQLMAGAQIRTGADGIVALYRDEYSMVIVDNNSEVEIKTLGGTAEIPVTEILLLSGAAALDHHAAELPQGAVFSITTPEGNTGQIVGSTVRVQYNPDTKVMTATCLTGTCEFVRGDQKLTLQAGQAVDVEGLQPPPGAPEEMSVEQANQFLAMGGQLCGCEIKIGDIRDAGLSGMAPPNLEGSGNSNESGNTNSSDNSNSSGNSNDSGSSNSGNDSSGGDSSGGGDSGGGDSGNSNP